MELIMRSPTEIHRSGRASLKSGEELEEILLASPGGIRLYPNGMIFLSQPEQQQYSLCELSDAIDGVMDMVISRSLKHIFVFDENASLCCREVNENATLLLTQIGYSQKQKLLGIVLVIPSGLFI